MSLGTNYVTTENQVATSDARFDMRLTGKFDNEDASASGWAWVAAILVAGTLIVSGYLDQESGNLQTSANTGVVQTYASSTSARQTVIADANRPAHRLDKGY